MIFPWSDMMHDEIEWEARAAGADEHGQPTYGTATTIKCRISYKQKMVRTVTGEERVSNATIYCEGDPGIDPKDRVIMPDGSTPPILKAGTFKDETGSAHQELMV